VVIRHLPIDTPAEDISNGLVDLGFDVISVKQMTTMRSSESGRRQINLPLFLITLIRNEKSQTIFKLNGLCHIAIRVEVFKAQNGITQCYNCQTFGHIWANCRQPPRCMCAEVATCVRSARRRRKKIPPPTAATAVYRKGNDPILSAIEAVATKRRSCCGGRTKVPSTRELQGGRSPPTTSPLGSRSQQRCAVTQGSSLRYFRLS
jgi:hypothetical protein